MFTKKHLKNKRLSLVIILLITLVITISGKLFLDFIYVPVIIMYHSVGDKSTSLDGYSDKLIVSPEAFLKQMNFLYRHNYNVIPLDEFINKIKNGEKIPHKTLAITFDDGLKDNFFNAYPVLKSYKLPATIFVVTDFIGGDKFLNFYEIKTMQKHNISIGSHTVSHPYLPSLTDNEVRRELIDSKRILEDKTGRKCEVLSYPLGGFNKTVEKIAEESGYMGAVSTNPGKDKSSRDPYALKRIRISMTSDNLLTFWIETSGFYTFIKEVRDD